MDKVKERQIRFRYRITSDKNYTEKARNPVRKTPRKSYPYRRIGSKEWFENVEKKFEIFKRDGKINGRKPTFSYYEVCYKDMLEKKEKGIELDYSHYLVRLKERDERRRESTKKYFYLQSKKDRHKQQYYIHIYKPDLVTRNMSDEEIASLYLKLKEENKQKIKEVM